VNELSNIKERILNLVKTKGISYETFFPQIGMTYASFKGNAKKTPLNSDAIENILTMFPDVNPTWLLTGEGEMIESNKTVDYRIDIEIQILQNMHQMKFLNEKITNINTIIDTYLKIPRIDDGSDFIAKLTMAKIFDTDYLYKWENFNLDEKRDLYYQLEQSVKILNDTFFERFKFLFDKTREFANSKNNQ
jgi:hypothetical protein